MEQAKSVIYASSRMDVPELAKVRDQLVAKYTKSILPDREIGVYSRLVLKLSMSYPERGLCERYLEAIAENFDIEWSAEISTEDEDEDELVNLNDSNEKHRISKLSSPVPSAESISSHESLNISSLPSPTPPPYTESLKASSSAPLPMDYSKQQKQQQQQQPQSQPKPNNNNLPDFDEFTRRFEALRKK